MGSLGGITQPLKIHLLIEQLNRFFPLIQDHLSNAHGSADHNLKALNVTLKEMLSHWFSAGFLNLERVTWQSSCEMLEKVGPQE